MSTENNTMQDKATTSDNNPIQDNNPKENNEYIFRFKLNPKSANANPDTMLLEFYQEQLTDLLKIIFLSRDGEKLLPNEFGFLNEPDKEYPLWKGQGE